MFVISQVTIFLVFIAIVSKIVSQESAQSSSELVTLLDKVAGVYTSSNDAKSKNLKKTVIVTACNYGYLNHLYNFDCYMRRLNMKYLIIAMDKQAYQVLQNNSQLITYFPIYDTEVTTTPQEFRSKQFNLITKRKKEAVLSIMKLGYDVLFSDTDVAVVRDPIPYLLWNQVDYVHSSGGFCSEKEHWDFFRNSDIEGNTGFYYVKANQRTIKLWEESISATSRFPRYDDQAIFWTVIREIQHPPVLHIEKCRDYSQPQDSLTHPNTTERYLIACMLDPCVFSGGMISHHTSINTLFGQLQKLNEKVCTLHANYISGNQKKANALKKHNYWIAEISETGSYTCLSFQENSFISFNNPINAASFGIDSNWHFNGIPTSDIPLIQNLTALYALAMDESRMEDWLNCWCPYEMNPSFENPAGKFVGQEGFERLIPILVQRLAGKRHFMTNIAVHLIEGDYAEQTCYMLILPKSGVPSILGTAVYRDTLKKINGQWKFQSRKIEFDPLTV